MKVISIKKEKILMFIYIAVIAIGLFRVYRNEAVSTFSMPLSKRIITIDAGHGGWDPGKVADSKDLEKDINLQIAKKLQSYLEQGGSTVILTRSKDEALGDRKAQDMKERINIANTHKSEIFVSIHQNSYPNESVTGAQVFYFNNSEESQTLAESIQAEIKATITEDKHHPAKSNSNYYLLKKTTTPSVIVECGFLSSPQDTKKLTDEEYQDKIAWAIYKGIIKFYNEGAY